ncbi:unnamed protein product [Didymodactylos carnosus]|uniref:CBM1 domain-containing protein n=1 Tax=Didymodactylos carnosus TaxID=1234261 RepID=A0A814I0K9_9BILA|nr:unnamed protein product [Didymodactylos carnosus]CAF1017174.1 unnamed protein product [Didymodactylos carnosus]CAF3642947.1 unnamed protein product [Didymodactylos carnosus]CAF3788670.1 unnamed protein product [Didymodactylos carnosus]
MFLPFVIWFAAIFVQTASVRIYEQCGGIGYTGSTQCDGGLQCFRRTEWFSSCQTSCPAGWECITQYGGGAAQPWDQCGGDGWRGAVGCTAGYNCYARSIWYSQCRPDCPGDWICSGYVVPTAPTTVLPTTVQPTTVQPTTVEPTLNSTTAINVTMPSTDAPVTDGDDEDEDEDDDEDYSDIEEYVDNGDDEELETDDFPDPSEYNLDEQQQKEDTNTYEPDEFDEDRRKKRSLAISSRAGCSVSGKSGTCIDTKKCTGTTHAGHCPGAKNIQCCIKKTAAAGSGTTCGSYAGTKSSGIKGNGGVTYSVVKVKRTHLANPSSYSLSSSQSDNTMTAKTACAFDKMYTAASKAGVSIKIASAFRTVARQNYFWNCYVTKKCNNGNLAARPGTSNHGKGQALDLNTNCGKQTGARPACGGSKVYQWLYKNGHKYGFTRTVKSEPWHWEFKGVGVGRASFS